MATAPAVSFGGCDTVLGPIVAMGVPPSECAKNHWIVHLKRLNFTVCHNSLNKAVTDHRAPTSYPHRAAGRIVLHSPWYQPGPPAASPTLPDVGEDSRAGYKLITRADSGQNLRQMVMGGKIDFLYIYIF